MKLTKLQSEDLEHCVYIRLDDEDREEYETDQFLNNLLVKIQSKRLNDLTINEVEWLREEADNLDSKFSHNFLSDGDGKGDVLSARNLIKKLS
jgi:hypothetical protein